jgi:thiamine biosynthesis lipoprotein
VTLPAGVRFDSGGIGKGLAADLVAQRLVDVGAMGALVNLGGDLRAIGAPPVSDGWVVGVADPVDPNMELFRIGLRAGAVATTSSLKRRWMTTSGETHHLIDPATGQPAVSDVVGVTVVAQEAWWAEAVTKALFIRGPDALGLYPHTHAVMVTADGRRHFSSAFEEIMR